MKFRTEMDYNNLTKICEVPKQGDDNKILWKVRFRCKTRTLGH